MKAEMLKYLDQKIVLKSLVVILSLLFTGSNLYSQLIMDDVPELRGIDIEEHLGEYVSPDLWFINSKGERKQLGDYFNQGKPIFLMLAYYECPMLCTLVLNAAANGARQVKLFPGKDYEMLTISIDPEETPKLALDKQYRYNENLGKSNSTDAWKFHVGEEEQIKKLANQLGFKYYYDEKRDEYAHPAVAFILTEEGKIARYLYGIDFKPHDLRLGLLEASEGKIGSTIDRIILYCFHYDPEAKGYVIFAANVMKAGGALTLIILSIFFVSLWTKEKLRKARDEKIHAA